MNVEQWVEQFDEAYKLRDLSLTQSKINTLLLDLSSDVIKQQEDFQYEAMNIMVGLIFNKASKGKTFGLVNRIKDYFGKTIEENYGISTGPFADFARCYWTFKAEISDISQENFFLVRILNGVEFSIASVFFPTPGPISGPSIKEREKAQRKILERHAPNIDIDRFLSENPILAGRKQPVSKMGCILGTLALIGGFIFVAFIMNMLGF